MMTVIGNNQTQELKMERWNNLLESKRSLKMFRNSLDEQEQRIADVDAEYFSRTLSKYVN